MNALKIETTNRVKKISNAVIGIVDIIASSKISNAVDIDVDWELRTRFFAAARERAAETGVALLHHTGDGFLFMLVPDECADWADRLLKFHAKLTFDFQAILQALRISTAGVQSGLRFGVSAGPVLVGSLDGLDHDKHVVGPDVNLAARMCAVAKANELVLSSRVWHLMKRALHRKTARRESYRGLKGFQFEIHALHLKPEAQVEIHPPRLASVPPRARGPEFPLVPKNVSNSANAACPPEEGTTARPRARIDRRKNDLRFKSWNFVPKRDGEGLGRLNESLHGNC